MRTGRRMSRGQRIAAVAVGFFIVMPLVVLLFGTIVEHLWNWLMPAVFHLPMVSFAQAIGLMVLSWILFGLRGVGTPRARRGGWRREWMRLTPEERERLLRALEARHERPPFEREGEVGG